MLKHQVIIIVAFFSLIVSCKKDNQPVAGQEAARLQVNGIADVCYPTAINLRYADADLFPAGTLLQGSYNRQFNIKYEDYHPVTSQSVVEGDTITNKFLYDRYNNLRFVNSYKKGEITPVDYIELEYKAGASNSYSTEIMAKSYRRFAGNYQSVYTRKLIYNAQGKLIRVFSLHGVDKSGFLYLYNSTGNLTTVYQVRPDGNTAQQPAYLYSDFDNAKAVYATHRVWELLAGWHTTNNPRKSTHLFVNRQNGYLNSVIAGHTYQFNEFGLVTSDTYSGTKDFGGQQIPFGPFTKNVATYPCIIMTPQPLPASN